MPARGDLNGTAVSAATLVRRSLCGLAAPASRSKICNPAPDRRLVAGPLAGSGSKRASLFGGCATVGWRRAIAPVTLGRLRGGGDDMGGEHEKQDDKDKYTGNGHKPGPIPDEDPGGKHSKDDDKKDDDKK